MSETPATFADVLDQRIEEMASACTQCGDCFHACPMTSTLGIADTDPTEVLGGIVGLLRGEDGTEEARLWSAACSTSQLCRGACDYGVDPHLLVRFAAYQNVRKRDGAAVRKNALTAFRGVARAVRIVSRLQLDEATLARLQTDPGPVAREAPPQIAFYTGCNVVKTPHILLLCLHVLDAIDVSYEVLGGTTSCCGVNQFRAGDAEISGRAGLSALAQIEAKQASVNVSWCPSCQSQFDDLIIPNHRMITARDDFELVPFFEFLAERIDRLRPLLTRPVHKRVALNERPGFPKVVAAVEKILAAVPGVELVRLDVPRAGLMSNSLTLTPKFKERIRQTEFAAAAAAGVTTLATIFHACHRELCHYEKDVSFEIINVMEIIAESMGFHVDDVYKRLKIAESAEEMLKQCAHLIERYQLDPQEAMEVLIADQIAVRPSQRNLPEIA